MCPRVKAGGILPHAVRLKHMSTCIKAGGHGRKWSTPSDQDPPDFLCQGGTRFGPVGGPRFGPVGGLLNVSRQAYWEHFVTAIQIENFIFLTFLVQGLNKSALHVVQIRWHRFWTKRGPDFWHPFWCDFRSRFKWNPGHHFEKTVTTFWPKSVTTFGPKSVTTFGPKSVTTICVEPCSCVAWRSRLHVVQHFGAVFQGFQGGKKSTSLHTERKSCHGALS